MTKTVLLVEDSVSIRNIASAMLSGASYEVVEAINGKEGVAEANGKIDLIISNYNMPNMNGLDMVEKIKEMPSCKLIPTIMLTTEANADLKARGKALGISTWMIKPFTPEKLLFAVDQLVR